ncbi:hypothetical protein [uncultured Duncaniella sp.]|uniref:hypothetical protein n=1 Tax=uncultured Duncaniella sp. TaxID=2768039 RepID=UPI0025A99736|nr:hypothetical protein [uncultured Duncaniella sp.]
MTVNLDYGVQRYKKLTVKALYKLKKLARFQKIANDWLAFSLGSLLEFATIYNDSVKFEVVQSWLSR